MKNLIQYRYPCEVNFYNYLQTGNLDNLIKGLKRVEQLAKNEGTVSGDLWFKFSFDDTLATTIRDIETDLSLPASHGNHKFLIERIKEAVDLNGTLEVYYS
jgi:hypothetical protein